MTDAYDQVLMMNNFIRFKNRDTFPIQIPATGFATQDFGGSGLTGVMGTSHVEEIRHPEKLSADNR